MDNYVRIDFLFYNQMLASGCNYLRADVTFEVGDGACVQFWYGQWCGHLPLKDLYPDLFACLVDSWEA